MLIGQIFNEVFPRGQLIGVDFDACLESVVDTSRSLIMSQSYTYQTAMTYP